MRRLSGEPSEIGPPASGARAFCGEFPRLSLRVNFLKNPNPGTGLRRMGGVPENSIPDRVNPSLKSGLELCFFLVLTSLAPLLAVWSPPGEWYAALNKPDWNPPAWLFGPVWTALYVGMAVAAWIVWRRSHDMRAMGLYGIQLGLNAVWSPLFFGLKIPGLAFVEILLLLGAVIITASIFARHSRAAALLFAPYILWVSFAAFLNFTLWRLNP